MSSLFLPGLSEEKHKTGEDSLHWLIAPFSPPLALHPLTLSFTFSSLVMIQLGLSKDHDQHPGPSQESGTHAPTSKEEWRMNTQVGMEAHTG